MLNEYEFACATLLSDINGSGFGTLLLPWAFGAGL